MNFHHHQLFPSNIFDLLPEHHECYLYADLFQQIDATTIEKGYLVYQGAPEVCADCPLQSRCCQSAKGEARTINTGDKEPLRQQMNSKMATDKTVMSES